MIYLLTALLCEAKPIISHYKLKARPESPFPLYENETMMLVISGIGKTNSAAAAGFLGAFAASPSCWINIGIAGHPTLPLGTSLLAHKIVDKATAKSYYPFFTNPHEILSTSLTTVDHPEKEYPENSAYDMEASSFYPIACKFSTVELVHCYKVVSDNKEQPPLSLNPQIAEKLIEAKLPEITTFLQKIASLKEEKNLRQENPKELSQFLAHLHFTATQKKQLHHLLKKWEALSSSPLFHEGFTCAREALHFIEKNLHSHPLHYQK